MAEHGYTDRIAATIRTGAATARALLDPHRIGYLICYVTNRCNFLCGHCFYHAEIVKGRKPDELTAEELDTVARRLGGLIQLSLTGGEPFLRRDFETIAAAFARHTRPRFTTIPTNGWFTDRIEHFIAQVVREFPGTSFRLVISIDGIGAEHDRLREAPGSWERIGATCAAVDPWRRRLPNLVLDANVAYTAHNEARVVSVLETLDRDFAFDNLSVTYVRGTPKDPAARTRSRETYLQAVDWLRGRARRREHRFLSPLWRAVDDVTYDHFVRTVFDDELVTPCVAGRKLAVLSETGEVRPCEIRGESAGNVRDHGWSIPAVLASAANRAIVADIRDTGCRCGFECALAANVVWNRQSHPAVARRAVRNFVETRTEAPQEVAR